MVRQKRTKYTQGDINRIIDSVLHPAIERSKNPKPLTAVDALLHLINEGKLEESVRKTLAYNVLPKLRDRLLEGIGKREEEE